MLVSYLYNAQCLPYSFVLFRISIASCKCSFDVYINIFYYRIKCFCRSVFLRDMCVLCICIRIYLCLKSKNRYVTVRKIHVFISVWFPWCTFFLLFWLFYFMGSTKEGICNALRKMRHADMHTYIHTCNKCTAKKVWTKRTALQQ